MFQQTTNTDVTSVPDYDTGTDGLYYSHTQEVIDRYVVFDPFGIVPVNVNLQMDISQNNDQIAKITADNVTKQAQIDANNAQLASVVTAIPDLATNLNAVAQPANQVAQPADPAPKI